MLKVTNQWLKRFPHPQAVVLILPGLNQSFKGLEHLLHILDTNNISILATVLTGHDINMDPKLRLNLFAKVQLDDWIRELDESIQLALNEARSHKSPLYILAVSTGANLVTWYSCLNPHVLDKINKVVFYAPAFCVKHQWLFSFVSYLRGFWRKILIPSLAPKDMSVNTATPLSAYQNLMVMIQNLKNNCWPLNDKRVLVFVDEKDELLNVTKLAKLVSLRPLWKLVYLNQQVDGKNKVIHHWLTNKFQMKDLLWNKHIDSLLKYIIPKK